MLQPLPSSAAKCLIPRVCQKNPNESVGRACIFSKRVPQICVAIFYRHLDQSWNELSISATVGKWLFASICRHVHYERCWAAWNPRFRPIAARQRWPSAALQHLQTGRSCLAQRDRRVYSLLCGGSCRWPLLLSLGDHGEDQAPSGLPSRSCRNKPKLLVDSYGSLIFRVRISRDHRCAISE